MSTLKKLLSVILLVFTVFSVFGTVSFAADYEGTPLSEIYRDHSSYTMVAARKGSLESSPENSLSSIEAAVNNGADIVEIDIKMTTDSVLILMEDDTVTRTCYGYTDKTAVESMSYDEIKSLNLLMGEGGVNAAETDETVPSLEEVFQNKQNCLYLLDADWGLRNEIYTLAEKYDMLDSIIFYIGDAKTDEIAEWKSTLDTEPMIMTYFKGNVIFAATSAVKNAAEVSECIQLATKNPYGVIFGETVQNKASENNIRTMTNAAEPELCGSSRQDTRIWWDDLISRGFSIIMTDYVSELREYIDKCEKYASELSFLYDNLVNDWTPPNFNTDKYFDYKLAYTDAAQAASTLINDKSRAESDLVTVKYELQKAYDDINLNYEELEKGTAGMTVTPLRIFLCIFAAAAVTVVEIYFYKKKKKN